MIFRQFPPAFTNDLYNNNAELTNKNSNNLPALFESTARANATENIEEIGGTPAWIFSEHATQPFCHHASSRRK